MKASKFIEMLQLLISEQGDLNLCVFDIDEQDYRDIEGISGLSEEYASVDVGDLIGYSPWKNN